MLFDPFDSVGKLLAPYFETRDSRHPGVLFTWQEGEAGEIDSLFPIVAPTMGSSYVVDGGGRMKKSSFKRPNLGGQQLT